MPAHPFRHALVLLALLAAQADLAAQPLAGGAVMRVGTTQSEYGQIGQTVALSPSGKPIVASEGKLTVDSPDGKFVATGTDDHIVRFEPTDGGAPVRQLRGHTAYITALAFTPVSTLLASGSNDHTLRLWDTVSGEARHVCRGHDDQISAIAFAPDGKAVASASWDGTLRLWDTATGKWIRTLRGHRWDVCTVAYAPDGKLLASGGTDGTVRLWDAATGSEIRRWTVDVSGVRAVAFINKGANIVTVDGWNTRQEWDLTGKRPDSSMTKRGSRVMSTTVHCGTVAPDARTIALGHGDGTVRLYDAATGKELRVLGRHLGTVWSVTFSPDGKTLASSARRHGVVRLWNVATGAMVRSFGGHAGGVSRTLFTRDGKTLVAAGGSFEPNIRVYDVASAKLLCQLAGHKGYIEAIALAPDGKHLASHAWDHTVRLWDLTSGKELRRWSTSEAYGGRVGFTADGTGVFGRDEAGDLCVFDIATGRIRRRLAAVQAWLTMSPDGRLFATVAEQDITLVEVATGAIRRRLKAMADLRSGLPRWASFAPDGRRLLTASGDGIALCWDLARHTITKSAPRGRDDFWRDLSAGAEGADAALWQLVATPAETLAMLRDRLHPAPAGNMKRIVRLIAELDHDDFVVRQRATRDLEDIGAAARPVLEKAHEAPPSIEAKRRIEGLLARCDAQPPAPDELRALRALELLERIGTADARRIVAGLAKGAAGARLTTEAIATLRRLDCQ